ncbi:MAG: hypothetical protein HY921_05075 [Elusimicrobia bacterium]|nr:hypothetical protein [Elusimicrobiota bacterium]
MNGALEAEIISPENEGPKAHSRVEKARVLGLFGTVLALLTMVAAFGFGFMAFFSTTLASAALLWVVWPQIFSPQFTAWLFGSEQVSFWKLFLIFLALGTIVRLFRPIAKGR